MIRRLQPLLTLTAFLAPFAWAGAAHAGLESCGNIHVEARAECEVAGGVECEGMCEPVSFQAQCSGDLAIECRGECNAELSAECSGSCEADCNTQCELEPGMYDCRGECYGRCEGNCAAACEGDEDSAQCRASCEGACEGECSISCEGTPPSAECSGKCQASCEGSCQAEANIGCQIDCQRPKFPSCEAELEGGCKVDCNSDAALFCDGQYVDHGNNLEDCLDSLRAQLNVEVDVWAEGGCEPGRCAGEAGFSCACTASDDPWSQGGGLFLAALGVFVLGATRRARFPLA